MNPLDEEPPAKRRRTLPDTVEGGDHDVFAELSTILNSSSLDAPVPNLSGLHHVVQ